MAACSHGVHHRLAREHEQPTWIARVRERWLFGAEAEEAVVRLDLLVCKLPRGGLELGCCRRRRHLGLVIAILTLIELIVIVALDVQP